MYAKNHQIWLRRFKDKQKMCDGLTFLDHDVVKIPLVPLQFTNAAISVRQPRA